MMSDKTRSTVYIGVTNDLLGRVAQHRSGEHPGFTRDYHCTRACLLLALPEYSGCDCVGEAVERLATFEKECAG